MMNLGGGKLEVPGTPRSIYFDAETTAKAEALRKAMNLRSVSELVRLLIANKYKEMESQSAKSPYCAKNHHT
jgi:hypothetical protein